MLLPVLCYVVGRVGRQCVRQRQGPEELESSSSEENVPSELE